jgi:high-affinity K+ transport system ATPase subunit B
MSKREELIQLAGQVINGMMSADESVITTLSDRSIHVQAAKTAVGIAHDMLKEIDQLYPV